MATGPDTTTSTNSGTFDGLDATIQLTTPTWTDDTLPVDVSITTSGLSPDINIALVVDTSGSTGGSSGSDVDGDGSNDTFLEAEQFAAKALFQSFIDAGYDPAAVQITLIEYNSGGDTIGTFTLDQQTQFDNAVDGLNAGGGTNYESGLDEVLETWNADSTVGDDDTNSVVFLSDGFRNRGDNGSDEVDQLELNFNATVTAIGVGSNSSLGDLNVIDNTGGAERVDDVADLVDIITSPPPLPELTSVDILIDGVNYGTFTPGDGVLVETPLGFIINCQDIAGWPYTPGENIEVTAVANFADGGSMLSTTSVLIPVTICFGAGTQILTAQGYRAIDTLSVGDEVMTRDNGLQAIRWIGSTSIPAAAMENDPNLRPVKIAAGTFGANMPETDLTVSRQHRILVEDWRAQVLFDSERVLVPAHSLVNETTVTNGATKDGVTYFHIVFDEHEVIDAQGLMTESFHPCRATVLGMAPEARLELFKLFPELSPDNGEAAAFEPAYPMLKAFEGRMLADKMAN
ncbi:Hint domain-containing protein [Amylibacter sp. IMCC11727]|uniref:Hint domain-containing protein n=1 Tax=Amylibacter sp. IMCC11727 TaxID=3039851 RepID=UPI00244DA035|nr:Hint domain-containing protein [Amylibacter sp. IMCC11727]WGI20802.1 Hint domain-containing protein [Amylibacter sp. IMCC11727]